MTGKLVTGGLALLLAVGGLHVLGVLSWAVLYATTEPVELVALAVNVLVVVGFVVWLRRVAARSRSRSLDVDGRGAPGLGRRATY
jgi:hypothetical protein